MSVKHEKAAALLVPVDIRGETLEGFHAELESRLSEGAEEIRLDCSLLEHATSTHINTLWQARNRCEEAGVALVLTSVTYGLERVLTVLDLYDLFHAERDGVEAAAEARAGVTAEPQPVYAVDVAPTVEGIGEAMRGLHDYLMALNHGEMFAFDLETVFYEVTTNIRLHGQLRDGEMIRFKVSPGNGSLHLRFEDPGPRFDPTSRRAVFDPQRAISGRQRRGFGLAMIKRLVDRISYERENDRLNILDLEKKVRGNGGQRR